MLYRAPPVYSRLHLGLTQSNFSIFSFLLTGIYRSRILLKFWLWDLHCMFPTPHPFKVFCFFSQVNSIYSFPFCCVGSLVYLEEKYRCIIHYIYYSSLASLVNTVWVGFVFTSCMVSWFRNSCFKHVLVSHKQAFNGSP